MSPQKPSGSSIDRLYIWSNCSRELTWHALQNSSGAVKGGTAACFCETQGCCGVSVSCMLRVRYCCRLLQGGITAAHRCRLDVKSPVQAPLHDELHVGHRAVCELGVALRRCKMPPMPCRTAPSSVAAFLRQQVCASAWQELELVILASLHEAMGCSIAMLQV